MQVELRKEQEVLTSKHLLCGDAIANIAELNCVVAGADGAADDGEPTKACEEARISDCVGQSVTRAYS